jgi:hypothetical protein
MRRTHLALLALAAASSSCIVYVGADDDGAVHSAWSSGTGPRVRGDGTRSSEFRPAQEFRRLRVEGPMDVEVTVGGEGSLEVSADENLLPYIETRVDGDELVVRFAPGRYDLRCSPRIVATTAELTAVVLAGSGDARVVGLDGGDLEVRVRGSGDIELDGEVERLDVDVEGSGDVDAHQLTSRAARVRIQGSGDVDLGDIGGLDVEIDGSGDVRYRGAPAHLRKEVHGSGSIRPR